MHLGGTSSSGMHHLVKLLLVVDVWEALDLLRLTLEWCMMVSLLPDQACRPDRELDREDSIEVFWPTSLS